MDLFDFGELEVDILGEYSSACTTRIVGLAAEECGRLSYHVDQVFDKNDLMDPDFPTTMMDTIDDNFVTPADIVADICRERVEVVVETIDKMEKCWISLEKSIDKKHKGVATRLWEFVKEEAEHHVESLYGVEYKIEFALIGNSLFN